MKRWIAGTLIAAGGTAAYAVVKNQQMPADVGRPGGPLAPVPSTPNAVSSLADDDHYIEPFPMQGDEQESIRTLRRVLRRMPECRLMTVTDWYIHAVFHSKTMRYKDDVEFLINKDAGHIDVRSAARMGYSDMGVNRKRIDRLRGEYIAESLPDPSAGRDI
ncbi:DUF1499 domain-containing protein [Alkalicoccus urumqiensis]|uniref:DUF1499 domain-containing protein n=1 Tax=Alkalicoccus urumqiensis TaxID=1548213 RepID=UPI0015E5F5F4|nr:DUF1499 domain-containing protein [Alkalicoccus urumqiensis]